MDENDNDDDDESTCSSSSSETLQKIKASQKTESKNHAAAAFYQRIGESAKSSSTKISTVAIEGGDCDLEFVSKLSQVTGGELTIVKVINDCL